MTGSGFAAPCVKVLAGRIGGTANDLKGVRVEFGESPFDRFGVFTISAADGRPLGESGRILIADMASCRNTGMAYSEDRHRIRNWGGAPILGEVVPAKVRLPVKTGKCRVYALDGKGRRVRQVRVDEAGDGAVFEIDDAAGAVWFEILVEVSDIAPDAKVSCMVLDNTRDLVAEPAEFKDGVLKLKKADANSAAYFVAFD